MSPKARRFRVLFLSTTGGVFTTKLAQSNMFFMSGWPPGQYHYYLFSKKSFSKDEKMGSGLSWRCTSVGCHATRGGPCVSGCFWLVASMPLHTFRMFSDPDLQQPVR
ncbi:hypothetical protein BaRGS_00031971 [Batillaria attramentaria]|uniref:Secreted protein n=1 Tax=Batillaria attramentaria TaxID=370345 RepID=A0ABD0JP46_9CAEN